MHVLMTVNAAWNIWNFRRPLVEALMAANHRITVLAPRDSSVPDLQALGCRFVDLEMQVSGLNPAHDLVLTVRMRRRFRSERPDVVLGFTVKNNIFGALAAQSLGIPFIPNVTGLGTAFLSGGLLRGVAERLYRTAFRPLPIVFFQNPDDRDHFVRRGLVHAGRSALLPGSGIDLDRFAPAPMPEADDAPVFLMIARLLRDKGVLEFAEAAGLVKERHPGACFRLLGPSGSRNRTAIPPGVVARWQSEGSVDYLGEAADVRPHIAAASCVVLPSYREGAPRVLIEAASMGRPVITTDVPGCRSVVEAGRTGLLCEVRSGASLADACTEFLRLDATARAEMGRRAREKMVREFDQRKVVDAYLAAISSVAGSDAETRH